MGVFPSDHYIKDVDEFQRVLIAARDMVEHSENLVTMELATFLPQDTAI